jgi:hypothetical protein
MPFRPPDLAAAGTSPVLRHRTRAAWRGRAGGWPGVVGGLLVSLGLAGCGGGGGGAIDEGPLPVFVDGAVSKGPVAGARVCGVWIVGGVVDTTTETCTTSGADGAYTLQMPRRTGLLSVTASGGSYRDEATGTSTALRTLRSTVAFAGTGNNVVAQVTALTEVMVQRAQARGRLDETTVAAATTEVERTFGVSGLTRTRPADVTAAQANLSSTPELQYGLSNAGVSGWIAERGLASLEQALSTLSSRIGAATMYDELASYRAGMRRVITANPASGLNQNAAAYAAFVALDFGSPPPQPTRPLIVEQPGTQRFAVRWPLDDLFARPVGTVCVTNVPSTVPVATVLAAMQAHAATYKATVTSMTATARCIGSGQSITIDWSQTSANPWGTAVWGDEG